MKIVIASDSYKGTVPSWRIGEIVADAAKCALKDQYAKGELEIAVIVISDGGEGALEAIGCQVKMARVKNPDGEMIDARYGMTGKIAFIESANANGYALTKLKNPEKTTSSGSSYGGYNAAPAAPGVTAQNSGFTAVETDELPF